MKLNNSNFNKILNTHHFFEEKPVVAVAVSGGPDSMALLYLLNFWVKTKNGKIKALIIDHKIRNDSSIEAKKLLEHIKHINIGAEILSVRKKNIGTKSMGEARINRYNKLIHYCKKNKILHLFIGHHKDDNLETFLNRKVAGSDFEGLQSISNVVFNNINIIRPLLNFTKKEIYKFNRDKNISYIIDPSNINLNYTRPQIREFLSNLNYKQKKQIENDFSKIKKYVPIYQNIISEILISQILYLDKNKIIVDFSKFFKIDDIFLQKIIKKIYEFFYNKNYYLRSKKIEIMIDLFREKKSKIFNLKGMIIEKDGKFLVFSLKSD